MTKEEKSKHYKRNLNLLIENKTEDAKNNLLVDYKNNPTDLSLLHLLIISHILLNEKNEIINILRYEEGISLFGAKLGYIKNILIKNNNISPYTVGAQLLKRGWSDDAEIYFNIHSILSPDHDSSLVPLGESALKNGNYQKGVMLLQKAANNYFRTKNKGEHL